jgi:hypothetical protein
LDGWETRWAGEEWVKIRSKKYGLFWAKPLPANYIYIIYIYMHRKNTEEDKQCTDDLRI